MKKNLNSIQALFTYSFHQRSLNYFNAPLISMQTGFSVFSLLCDKKNKKISLPFRGVFLVKLTFSILPFQTHQRLLVRKEMY